MNWRDRIQKTGCSESVKSCFCYTRVSASHHLVVHASLSTLPTTLSPEDGVARGHCELQHTQAWRSPDRPSRTFKSKPLHPGGMTCVSNHKSADDVDKKCGGYQLPPTEMLDIMDAPPTPALSLSPKRDKIVFLERHALPPLADVARPELRLAGLSIDPIFNTRGRMSFYTNITVCKILNDGGTLGTELAVHGLPIEPKINYLSWSPDGVHLAFTVRGEEQAGGKPTGLGLWVADTETGQARQLIRPPDMILNTIFDTFSWVNELELVGLVTPSRAPPPKRASVPFGPNIHSNETMEVVQNRTFQNMLKDQHDEDLFDYYTTAVPVLVSLEGETKVIGPPALYTSVAPSPDGQYFLVSSIHRPYSFVVPNGRFPRKTELWTRDGELLREICDRPLAEDVPATHDSVEKGRRHINWRADKPSSLYWVETQDGGDSRVNVSPRDIIYTQSAKDGEAPTVVFKLDLRFGGVVWGDESTALMYESWRVTRKTRTWAFGPGNIEGIPLLLFDRSTEDAYADPGSPMLRRTSLGTYVAAWTKGAGGKKKLLLVGSGATPEGNIPFLDLFDMDTGAKERIWQSTKQQYLETVVALMSDTKDDCDLTIDKLRILISRESQAEPPQYYLKTWPDQKVSRITNFPHPYPHLGGLKKEIISYKRSDGVQLAASLYLPPGYDPLKEGPLPTILWAYPEEFMNKDIAGQLRVSQNSFSSIGCTSPLLWLTRRFAVLHGATMPIIGEGDEKPNDRYVEQLVSSAQAAVDEVVKRGVADPKRIAVGGHSYGAFMTANLVAHAPHLFCCGIARGGAYNRTLTPFGFQNEERTFWEARNVYVDMSPFVLANKIKTPLLLMHGEDDDNTGAPAMQSERFYAALKGHGAPTRLVLFPFEKHGYQGRESVLHCVWEMDRWLKKYCVDAVNTHTASC